MNTEKAVLDSWAKLKKMENYEEVHKIVFKERYSEQEIAKMEKKSIERKAAEDDDLLKFLNGKGKLILEMGMNELKRYINEIPFSQIKSIRSWFSGWPRERKLDISKLIKSCSILNFMLNLIEIVIQEKARAKISPK